jgi:hypothetical protein
MTRSRLEKIRDVLVSLASFSLIVFLVLICMFVYTYVRAQTTPTPTVSTYQPETCDPDIQPGPADTWTCPTT